jgi:hypothetical protein
MPTPRRPAACGAAPQAPTKGSVAGRPVAPRALVLAVAALVVRSAAAAAQPTQPPVPQPERAAPPAVVCADAPDADPGTQRETCLTVPAGADGPALALPVVVVRGAAPGPTLVVTAGVHGAEYAPIVAAGRVRTRFAADPRLVGRLRGRLVLVLLANPPAFWGRSVYYGPADGRNLNRVFPGRADGTQSERIAWVLAERALRVPAGDASGDTAAGPPRGPWADAYLDLHAGDANEALVPHVYAPVTGDSAYDARALAFARGTGGAPVVLVRRGRALPAPGTALSSTGYGAARGIVTAATEAGALGGTDEQAVGAQERAVFGALAALGMLRAADAVAPDGRPLGPPRAGAPAAVVDSTLSFASPSDGVWTPAVDAGARVAAGALLGRLHDPYGRPLAEVRTPAAGRVLYVTRTPPARRGESLAYLAVRERPGAGPPPPGRARGAAVRRPAPARRGVGR